MFYSYPSVWYPASSLYPSPQLMDAHQRCNATHFLYSRTMLKPTSTAFRDWQVNGLNAIKHIFWPLNLRPLETNPWTFSFKTSSFHLPNLQYSVSRQAHPFLGRAWRGTTFGLSEAVFETCSASHIPPFPLTSPPPEGLGEAPSFWFLRCLLWCVLCCYLSISFPSVFQSTPF